MIPPPVATAASVTAANAGPSEQSEVEHGVVGALLDEDEGREQHDPGRQQPHHERAPPALAALGQPGEAGAPCRARAARTPGTSSRARWPTRDSSQPRAVSASTTPAATSTTYTSRQEPTFARPDGEQRAEGDAGSDAGAPDPGGVGTLARVGEGDRDHPEPGRDHRRAADALHDPGDHEGDDLGSDTRRTVSRGQDARRAGHEGPAPPEVVGHPAGREQEGAEPDAHRAEDPGPPRGPGAQTGDRQVDGRERRGEGHERDQGAERGGGEGTAGGGHGGSGLVW